MNKKNIALIYAGGTIGMAKTSDGYAPMADFAAMLERLLENSRAALPDYSLIQYATPIDSTNATPADWQKIGRDIAARYHHHDGFVVLHGTDTMAYTATALSFMLQGLRKPVIVTGSQIPMVEARSDALQNLVTALQLAASDKISEVALYFNQRLLRGNRSSKVSAKRYAAFDSPNYPHLGQIEIDVQLQTSVLLPRPAQEKFEMPEYGSGRVLSLRFLPGMPLQVLQAMLALQPQALVLECYGAGNVPDNDPALLDMLSQASAKGIVLVACSQCQHGGVTLGAYATGSGLTRAGVIGAADMTFEAIIVKLHHLFAMNMHADEVRAAFLRDLSGELSTA